MTRRMVLAVALVLGAVLTVAAPAGAEGDARDDPSFRELAEKHRPIVMVKAQDGPCDDDGEPFEPASVEIVLDNAEVFLRQVGNGDAVAMRAPGAADIFHSCLRLPEPPPSSSGSSSRSSASRGPFGNSCDTN